MPYGVPGAGLSGPLHPSRDESVVSRGLPGLIPPLDRYVEEANVLNGFDLLVVQRGGAVSVEVHPTLDNLAHVGVQED